MTETSSATPDKELNITEDDSNKIQMSALSKLHMMEKRKTILLCFREFKHVNEKVSLSLTYVNTMAPHARVFLSSDPTLHLLPF